MNEPETRGDHGTRRRAAAPKRAPQTISGQFVALFLRSARCTPAETTAILARAGVVKAAADPSDIRLEEDEFTRFLVALSRWRRDEFWGLAARPVPLGTFSTLCRLVVQCGTLGEALALGGRFYRLVIDEFALKTRTVDGATVISLKSRVDLEVERRSALHGASLFLLYQLMCWLVDARLPLLSVDLAFPRRSRSVEALRAYDAQVIRFDQPQTSLTLPSHLMSLPILGDAPRLARFLSQAPREMLVRYHDQNKVSDRVRAVLHRRLGESPSLDEVAQQLHMTAITLKRHLAQEEGRSFSDLRDSVRRRAAIELVGQGTAKLEGIAQRLGFAEYSTFHRAFKRWTGTAPGEFREQSVRKAM